MNFHEQERDPVTGQATTGHEWNGIKELNTPVPKIVFIALILGGIYLAVSTILLPAWPTFNSYTRGLLGIDQRTVVEEQVALGQAQRAVWTNALTGRPLEAVAADPATMEVVRVAGHPIFKDNCAACHGNLGTGQAGFPNIAQAPMMWGDGIEEIYQTIRAGINSGHPETRWSQMLAFGKDGMMSRGDIVALTDYVEFLSGGNELPVETIERAAQLFADNCASCHGTDARGEKAVGAPDLTDEHWIYGGTREDIFHSLFYGRQGHMPHWEGRLSDVDIRTLALYVSDLRSASQ